MNEVILEILESHIPQYSFLKLAIDQCSCGHEYDGYYFIPQQHAAHVGPLIQEYVDDVI